MKNPRGVLEKRLRCLGLAVAESSRDLWVSVPALESLRASQVYHRGELGRRVWKLVRRDMKLVSPLEAALHERLAMAEVAG